MSTFSFVGTWKKNWVSSQGTIYSLAAPSSICRFCCPSITSLIFFPWQKSALAPGLAKPDVTSKGPTQFLRYQGMPSSLRTLVTQFPRRSQWWLPWYTRWNATLGDFGFTDTVPFSPKSVLEHHLQDLADRWLRCPSRRGTVKQYCNHLVYCDGRNGNFSSSAPSPQDSESMTYNLIQSSRDSYI